MVEAKTVNVRARQNPLRERYKEVPEEALITDWAKTTGGDRELFQGS